MKKLSALLAFLAFLFAGELLANGVVTSATGSVQAQIGSSAPRMLRQGDEVVQGTTVFTGAASSVVLRFPDGQIAALTANSRMTVTAYQYDTSSGSGNVLLSLIGGGMRAITGLIGRKSPERVSYRAATATIGIRGTDATIVTIDGDVLVSVTEGEIAFTFRDQTIIIPAGQAIHLRANGTFTRGAIQQIMNQLQGTPLGQSIVNALGGLSGLASAIQQAQSGSQSGDGLGGASGGTPGTGGASGGGAGGGGTGSPS